jgi:hypothetical protein
VPLPASSLPKTIVSALDEEKMLACVFVRSWSLEPLGAGRAR